MCSSLDSLVAQENETLWLEAEHFTGISGYCWPMGDDTRGMRKTDGNWGLSGPGWAAEWNQGGESGFLSIATSAGETAARVSRTISIPRAGTYFVWVRYADWREKSEAFDIQITQAQRENWHTTFGEFARTEEDNEMKLYWDWAFAWDVAQVSLTAGDAELQIVASQAQEVPRQVDVVVLTTDSAYQPRIKDQPEFDVYHLLDAYQNRSHADWRPLARRNLWGVIDGAREGNDSESQTGMANWSPPANWVPRTFGDRGFRYLWNVSHTDPLETWLSDDGGTVRFPYNIIDPETRAEFQQKYGGASEIPIFSDPRITPTFHGVGPGVFATDPESGEVRPLGLKFAKWLDQNPDRTWAMMMNYHPGAVIGPQGIALFQKYRDRYLGSIAGESLGYFYPEPEQIRAATAVAGTRRELVRAFETLTLAANAEKYRKVFGTDLDPNPFVDVISCHSIGSLAFAPLCYRWGARTVGYESSAATATLLGMRWAFLRGAARQFNGLTATYRSCNFGDSSTIFSKGSSFSGPENILDNYYSVYSGAGMTWYKFDIWYQYMAGSSMFYHEQGFDEFWKPGGTTAAGKKPVQLSPKGKLVDRFLRTTQRFTDRGAPVTPIAFLIDYAHGWEPATFWPNSFVNWHQHPDRFLHSAHEQMLQQWFWCAFHPIGEESQKPINGVNEVIVAGVFGDIFDCIFATPELEQWKSIDDYPVVIALGDLELSDPESSRLNDYVRRGGTLLISLDQIPESAAARLALPAGQPRRQAQGFRMPWSEQAERQGCAVFDYAPLPVDATANSEESWHSIADAENGDCIAAYSDRGAGRIIVLSIPRGLTVSGRLHPLAALLMAHLTQRQMPIEVAGKVQWMVNRAKDAWLLTLINPAGQAKPQQGITPTDYRQNQDVTVQVRWPVTSVRDWLAADESISIDSQTPGQFKIIVPAGGVRILEIR